MKRVLAVSSSGGHWSQLSRLCFFLDKYKTTFACTNDVKCHLDKKNKFYKILDANLNNKLFLFFLALQMFFLVIIVRPQVVISTGAAPGYFAILFSKILFNSKTIWIDSIANGEEPSLSGLKVKKWADLWLTQWPNISEKYGMKYIGELI